MVRYRVKQTTSSDHMYDVSQRYPVDSPHKLVCPIHLFYIIKPCILNLDEPENGAKPHVIITNCIKPNLNTMYSKL